MSEHLSFENADLLRDCINNLPESQTLRNMRVIRQLRAEGRKIYGLGFGQSAFTPPQVVCDRLGKFAKKSEYGPAMGFPEIRETIAKWFSRKLHKDVKESNVLVAPGVKLIIHHLLSSFKGDVLIPAPAWASYIPIATLTEHNVITVDTCYDLKWRTTAENLEAAALKAKSEFKILILNYPDAMGLSFDDAELKAIAEVCRKHKIIVIADEIYSAYLWEGEYCSLATHYPEGTIILEGLSKWAGAGGWRFGCAMFPDELATLYGAVCKMGTQTYSLCPAPIQWAGVAAFEDSPEMKEYIEHTRKLMKYALDGVWKILSEGGLEVHRPVGSFYVFADFRPFKEKINARGIPDSGDLRMKLLEEAAVALLPASSMGMDPSVLAFRVACIDFDGDAAFEASKSIPLEKEFEQEFLDKYLGHLFEGASAMVDWAKKL